MAWRRISSLNGPLRALATLALLVGPVAHGVLHHGHSGGPPRHAHEAASIPDESVASCGEAPEAPSPCAPRPSHDGDCPQCTDASAKHLVIWSGPALRAGPATRMPALDGRLTPQRRARHAGTIRGPPVLRIV